MPARSTRSRFFELRENPRPLTPSVGRMVTFRTRYNTRFFTTHFIGDTDCSSTTGLLFELGPRQAVNETGVVFNEYSWDSHSDILSLNQPVNVGYSYSDGDSKIERSAAAGEDAYAFFHLFFSCFPEYSKALFHIEAEGCGGHVLPVSPLYSPGKSKQLTQTPVPGLVKMSIASVILANVITDPYE